MPWIDETTPPRFEITNEALDTYKQMRALKCTCEPPPKNMAYWDAPEECSQCLEWALLNRKLARLVKLPVYEVHVTPPPSGEGFLLEAEGARQAALEAALAEREGKP
jgi:hypothetical protein